MKDLIDVELISICDISEKHKCCKECRDTIVS